MQEHMLSKVEFDPMMVMSKVSESPIKLGEVQTSPEVIDSIMAEARACLRQYSMYDVRGTCMDERPRIGLRSGEVTVGVRPSAPGGPDIYGLAVAELTGVFGDSSSDAETRIKGVKKSLNRAGLISGGHQNCAADDSFAVWVPIVSSEKAAVSQYVKDKIEADGLIYDQDKMNEVIANAEKLDASGRYADWSEEEYFKVLGDEAGYAIEKLKDVNHEGILKIWVEIDGYTVDQSSLDNKAFILDKPYMKKIEDVVTTGPDATGLNELARYARYAIVKAISFALPNKELQEGTLKK